MEGKQRPPRNPKKDREPGWLTVLRVAGLVVQLVRLWVETHGS